MEGNRTMTIALVASVAFHLSMVSLFSIGIWFPVEERTYYRFDIVEEAAGGARAIRFRSFDSGLLRVPSVNEVLGGDTAASSLDAFDDRRPLLPTVELPMLEFTQLERLQLQAGALDSRSRLDQLRAERRVDTWTRFGAELSRFGDALISLSPFDRFDEPAIADVPVRGPVRLAPPAPGFEAYIEWLSGDPQRQVLLAPPIDALRNVDPREWREPVSLVLKVNREGRVIEILSPMDTGSPIMSRVWRAVLNYRFEPVSESERDAQHGTLFIAAAPNVS